MPFEVDLMQQYLRGEADLEPVARALANDDGTGFGVATPKDPPYTAEEQTYVDRLTTLFTRVDATQKAERLIESTATIQSNGAWDPPDDPATFCLSIEVILRGRDAEQEYQELMRVSVCTPRWLSERAAELGWTWQTPSPLVWR